MKPLFIRHIVCLAAFVALSLAAVAQEFSTTLSHKKVSAGQRFTLTYTVQNYKMDKLVLPKLDEFRLVGGPNEQTSTFILNGRPETSYMLSYDFVCDKPGTYTIPGATLKSGRKTYTSNSLKLQVTAGGKQQPATGGGNRTQPDPIVSFGGGQPQPEESITEEDLKKNLSLEALINKTSIYPGEAVTVTHNFYTLYRRFNFAGGKFPEYRNALSIELAKRQDIDLRRVPYRGKVYSMCTLSQILLIPQKPGKISINPASLAVTVEVVRRTGDAWVDLFGGMVTTELVGVSSNPLSLNVKEFPEAGKPLNFKGAVGQFALEVSLDKNTVWVNDALTLRVTLSGKGNLNLVDAPKLVFPSAFEAYSPTVSDKIKMHADSGIYGSKTFEYVLMPRDSGTYRLPAVQFSYFDPQTEKYNTITSDSLGVRVSIPEGVALTGHIRNGEQEEVLLPIKRGFDTGDTGSGFFPPLWFAAVFGALFMATLVLWFARTKIWDLRADTGRRKVRMAHGTALQRLGQAGEIASKGNTSAFYEACYRALVQYLQDRMDVELSAVTADKLAAHLRQKGISEVLATEAAGIVAVCETARFAPSGVGTQPADFKNRCIRFINDMEKQIP